MMESPPDRSPSLPWEVIERIIGQSCDLDEPEFRHVNPESILNFSLTCRDLRPRSLCFLVAHPAFSSRDRIFDFCDFLQAKPYLKPLVRSIAVQPTDFAPVPLLRILPNLSEVKFINVSTVHLSMPAVIHPSIHTCCQRLSMHIQTLCLCDVSFKTGLQFLQVLSAFANIAHLVCSEVHVDEEGDRVPLNVAKQRLSQRLRLLTLNAHCGGASSAAVMMLLDWGLIQSTLESLTVQVDILSSLSPWQSPGWCQLRYLMLKLKSSASEEITSSIAFLQLNHITPKEVIVEIYERDLLSFPETLAQHADLYEKLESTLLRFSRPQLVWIMNILPVRRNSFWIQELGKHFPALLQRGALAMVPNPVLRSGHTMNINTIVISPDNKWVASASTKGTVILSDITNGAEVQQWVPHNFYASPCLAFSSDSQYLVSSADSDMRVVIWDLHGGHPKALERHPEHVTGCVWSPVGDLIAFWSYNATVRLWDAKAFRSLHVLEHAAGSKVVLAEFSPNGRWLITGCLPFGYYVWDVVSGTGKTIQMPAIHRTSNTDISIAAAFDPGNTRVAIISSRLGGIVEILDTEDVEGNPSIIIGGSESRLCRNTMGVAFSPDGKLVLTVPNHLVSTHVVRIWDANTGVEILSLEGHKGHVVMACFSPCGRFVASASLDRTVRLWSTSDGSCIATLTEHKTEVHKVVFSPDGKTLISGAEDGSVIIRRMRNILPKGEPGPAGTHT